MRKCLALLGVALTVASVIAGCSEKAPDKPAVDKSQFQAPQGSFQKRYSGSGGQAAPPGPAAR